MNGFNGAVGGAAQPVVRPSPSQQDFLAEWDEHLSGQLDDIMVIQQRTLTYLAMFRLRYISRVIPVAHNPISPLTRFMSMVIINASRY
jgi:hypothetical protein